MKLLGAFAVLAALVVAGWAVLKLRGNRLVDRPIGTLATVRVPARLEPWAPTTNWLGTHLRMTRLIQNFLPGSNPTYHEDMVVTQLVPRQLDRLGSRAFGHLYDAFGGLDRIAWSEPVQEGGVTVRHGHARYTTGSVDEPARVVQLLDAERGIVVSYRTLERQGRVEESTTLARGVLDSYRLVTPLDAHFGSLERDLGGGMFISLPVEFFDPFMLETDRSGVRWRLFRHHPDAAENPALLERALAVVAFFAPGNVTQASTARAILRQEAFREATVSAEPETGADGLEVTLVRHASAGRSESAWLVTGFDTARGVGVSLRLWQHDASRAEALAIVTRALASYRFTGEASWFLP